jgi:hypothetical protein
VPSHGGSATVIYRTESYSLLLTAGHLFEGSKRDQYNRPVGKMIDEPIAIDAPVPLKNEAKSKGGQIAKVGIKLLAVDFKTDLAVFKVNYKLPYVAPLPPAGHKLGPQLLSVGFDKQQLMSDLGDGLGTRRMATPVRQDQGRLLTEEKPWHGRSGGAILDGPFLVGVVSAYQGLPAKGIDPKTGKQIEVRQEYDGRNRGIYVNLDTIRAFLAAKKIEVVGQTPMVLAQAGGEQKGTAPAVPAQPLQPPVAPLQPPVVTEGHLPDYPVNPALPPLIATPGAVFVLPTAGGLPRAQTADGKPLHLHAELTTPPYVLNIPGKPPVVVQEGFQVFTALEIVAYTAPVPVQPVQPLVQPQQWTPAPASQASQTWTPPPVQKVQPAPQKQYMQPAPPQQRYSPAPQQFFMPAPCPGGT